MRELWRAFVEPLLEPSNPVDWVLHVIVLVSLAAVCAVGTVIAASCVAGVVRP